MNEGYGDNKVWVKKKNYAANKFHYSIKQLEYLDDLEALKYTGFREFIAYKINNSPYTHKNTRLQNEDAYSSKAAYGNGRG